MDALTGPRLLLVDNLDSFSFMLADYLRSAGAEVDVVRAGPGVDADHLADVGRRGAANRVPQRVAEYNVRLVDVIF
mgnify:CR=1 FL=1